MPKAIGVLHSSAFRLCADNSMCQRGQGRINKMLMARELMPNSSYYMYSKCSLPIQLVPRSSHSAWLSAFNKRNCSQSFVHTAGHDLRHIFTRAQLDKRPCSQSRERQRGEGDWRAEEESKREVEKKRHCVSQKLGTLNKAAGNSRLGSAHWNKYIHMKLKLCTGSAQWSKYSADLNSKANSKETKNVGM